MDMESNKRYFSNGQENNLIETFQHLRQKSSMFDVRLGCVDSNSGKINCIPAHRVLLAAYSPVLTAICENSIQQNLSQQPYIHLVGISNINLYHLLNFMYNGEVDLPHGEINSFLAAAKQLQIRGIADEQGFIVESLKYDNSTGYSEKSELKTNKKYGNLKNPESNIFAQPIVESEQENMAMQELVCSEYSEMDLQSSPASSRYLLGSIKPLVTEPVYSYHNQKLQNEIDAYVEEKISSQKSNFDEPCFSKVVNKTHAKREVSVVKSQKSLMITKTQEGWQCKTCMYSAKHKHTVRDHALRKHSAPECITCHFCQKICRDRVKFRNHLRNCSKIVKKDDNAYTCSTMVEHS